MATDWDGWLQRWEAQQNGYMPDREERFGVIAAAVRAAFGDAPRILDLGCGPGSLANRLVEALPGAEVVAVDVDPVLLEIGRRTCGDRRIRYVDADLGDPRLPATIGESGFDAAVSTTALHWLRAEPLERLYVSVAELLQPSGILLNGDYIAERRTGVLADLVHNMRARRELPATGAESWGDWWTAVLAEPGLAEQAEERARRHHDHPDDEEALSLEDHVILLGRAGLLATTTLWERLDNRVLAAARS